MASPVRLLQLSPTMTEGTLVKWLVKEGDEVESGTPIAEVETDKAVMEQESFEDGKILKIVVKEGEKIAVESLIAIIGEEGEDVSGLLDEEKSAGESKPAAKPEKAPAETDTKVAPAEPEDEAPIPTAKSSEPVRKEGERVFISPLARKMIAEHDLDVDQIKGTGPNGRIVKRDIESALKQGTAAAAKKAPAKPAAAAPAATPAAAAEELPVSGMRATIARRLTESKQQVPHFQVTVNVRAERLLEAVKRIRDMGTEPKVTVTHFLIKAMAGTIMRHRAIRSQWADDTIRVINGAHISIAIAIEEGLLTPVMRDVHTKGVIQIAKELQELAARAKERKLTGDDMAGGVQTISNLGMYGVDEFNAIINPPEASILAVGATQDRPVVEDGQVVPGKVMSLTLSADHRVVDGAVAAEYLRDLRRALEDPMLMLL